LKGFSVVLLHLLRRDLGGSKLRQGETALDKLRADLTFKERHCTAEVILWVVRWYLMFPISYRDLKLMLQDRGVEVYLQCP
jgi:hypothetical protein